MSHFILKQRVFIDKLSSSVAGKAEPIFNWGGGGGGWGLENERRCGEFVGGSGAILPQKSLKSRGSEMYFNILHKIFSVEKFLTVFV